MTPVKKSNAKKDRACVEAVRISLGQMVSTQSRNFHGDLRRITGQNHSKVVLEEAVRQNKCDDSEIKPKAFLPH